MDYERVRKYSIDNKLTKHAERRISRRELIMPDARPSYYFDVYRVDTAKRQVHCILEDATLIIYNKSSFEVVTVIIASRKTLNKYTPLIDKDTDIYKRVFSCALLNEKYQADKVNCKNKLDVDTKYIYLREKSLVISR